ATALLGLLLLSPQSTLFTKSARGLFSHRSASEEGRSADPIVMSSCVPKKCDRPSPALPSLSERGDQPRPCCSMNISVTSETNRKRTRSRLEPLPGVSVMGGPSPQPALQAPPGAIWTRYGTVYGKVTPGNQVVISVKSSSQTAMSAMARSRPSAAE